MKRTILLIFLFSIFCVSNVLCQAENPKVNKVGINFSNLDNFGIRFYTGTDKILCRVTALTAHYNIINFNRSDTLNNESQNLGFGLNIGIQRNKSINEKMDFYYGIDVLNYYSSDKSEYLGSLTKSWDISSGLGIVLGLSYKISEAFHIAAELVPSFSYRYNERTSEINGSKEITKMDGYFFGIRNSGASLTLAYQFGK